ncbi:MAG: helix-turn-helix transcriptional regulator [Firmicutes bacterium]|nr:helix-turn-helix transcriptional regulator [Bacillota bacterium]
MGKSWMIPKSFEGIGDGDAPFSLVMPLLNSPFETGRCLETINQMENPDLQAIAYGEYYYFTGQPEQAAVMVEPYLKHTDPGLAASANIIYAFAEVALGAVGQKIFLPDNLKEEIDNNVSQILKKDRDNIIGTSFALVKHIGQVLMHVPMHDEQKGLQVLPEGFRYFGVYVMAHDAYLIHDYQRALGMTEAGLALMSENYPIARIFLLLVRAASFASLRRMDEAKLTFMEAWHMAEKDGFVEPFAYHYTLLHGLVEICLKKNYPDGFDKVISATTRFRKGWGFYHERAMEGVVTDSLSPTELSVAMLYTKGWSIKEIAGHMDISDRMIKHHLSITYEKLGVSSRDELSEYMIPVAKTSSK